VGIDEPLATDDGSALSYFQADALGSIAKMTSAAGTVTLTRQYNAWGYLQAGASNGGYAFTGREWDPETGLYYYRARYYDPKIGRFLSEDPIGFDGGINLYGYVESRPTTATDPYGLLDPRVLCFKFGICPPGGGATAVAIPPPPKPRPTPTPINCSGGPSAAMLAGPRPSPTPPVCISEGLCRCGYEPVSDPVAAGLCAISQGAGSRVGMGAPPNGMQNAATRHAGTAGPPETGGRAPGFPNAGGASGAGLAGAARSASFCMQVEFRCVRK
jgi:RHS repeat-associated protein